MAHVDAALMQQILDVSEREGEADIHHHRQADDLGPRLEVAKGGWIGDRATLSRHAALLKHTARDWSRSSEMG
jgi:hypothetical protein